MSCVERLRRPERRILSGPSESQCSTPDGCDLDPARPLLMTGGGGGGGSGMGECKKQRCVEASQDSSARVDGAPHVKVRRRVRIMTREACAVALWLLGWMGWALG